MLSPVNKFLMELWNNFLSAKLANDHTRPMQGSTWPSPVESTRLGWKGRCWRNHGASAGSGDKPTATGNARRNSAGTRGGGRGIHRRKWWGPGCPVTEATKKNENSQIDRQGPHQIGSKLRNEPNSAANESDNDP
jgi:hypothetical protein